MNDAFRHSPTSASTKPQDWVRILAAYREPSHFRSFYELGVSFVPFVGLWAVAWWAISISAWLALAISILNAGFLLRLFIIQHDCGHGSYFKNRHLSDWVGRALGVLTLTPYDVWRRTHAIHHSAAGNLDKRGIGDIYTMTVEEYRNQKIAGRLNYRLYRNPFVLFGMGPAYIFVIQNRLPIGLMRDGLKYWTSAMGTNLAIAVGLGVIIYFGGLMPVLTIFLPTVLIAATIGMWLFFVQHQFEETHWNNDDDWQLHESALHGSSYYDLPPVLRWFSANIGVHHVHHLYSRIPFYRLPQVLRDHNILATSQRMTLRQSLSCLRLHLWDENTRRLLSFSEARKLSAKP